jgi:hypothetical protein
MDTIQKEIKRRLETTRLKPLQVAELMGYRNINRGVERFNNLLCRDPLQDPQLLHNALLALGATTEEIFELIENEKTRREKLRAREIAEAARNFQPHAVYLTERRVPSPIFIAAMSRSFPKRRFDFAENEKPINFPLVAHQNMPEQIIAFGSVTGFVVNYTPRLSLEFDRDGNPVAIRDKAQDVGHAYMKAPFHGLRISGGE